MLNTIHPRGERAYAGPPFDDQDAANAGAPRYAMAPPKDSAVSPLTYAYVVAFCVLLVAGAYLAIFSYVNGLIAALP